MEPYRTIVLVAVLALHLWNHPWKDMSDSWRHYDEMTFLQRQLYRLGFGNFMWFRRSVGGRWCERYWFPTPHSSDPIKYRWEYHPRSTFKGCLNLIEYWEEHATARALVPQNASIFAKVKVFIFSGFRVGVLSRLRGHGRTRRVIGREPSDVPILLAHADAEARGQFLAGADGSPLLPSPQARQVYDQRHDAFGEFLQAYEEYLDGRRSYSDLPQIKASKDWGSMIVRTPPSIITDLNDD
jgi:hypothetical protein